MRHIIQIGSVQLPNGGIAILGLDSKGQLWQGLIQLYVPGHDTKPHVTCLELPEK